MTKSVQERREYLAGKFDPAIAPRYAPAAHMLRSILTDGEWHSHAELMTMAQLASPSLKRNTCQQLIRDFRLAGLTVQRGDYRKHHDTREYQWNEQQ